MMKLFVAFEIENETYIFIYIIFNKILQMLFQKICF